MKVLSDIFKYDYLMLGTFDLTKYFYFITVTSTFNTASCFFLSFFSLFVISLSTVAIFVLGESFNCRILWVKALHIQYFVYQIFISQTLKTHRTTTFTRSWTFKHLFSTLHLRWLSSMFNDNACIYQTATRWDLPFYWTTISLIDDAMSVCLLDGLILGFCYSNLTRKSGRSELKLTITLALQANRISKYASNYTFTLHVSSFNSNKESKKEP